VTFIKNLKFILFSFLFFTVVGYAKSPSTQQAFKIATSAYIYGYPLVLMDVNQKIMTQVSRPTGQLAPINHFGHMRQFFNSQSEQVIRPNVDLLYSTAFLNLSKEPLILHLPDTQGRYYSLQLLDAWTNVFASLGKRKTGTKSINVAIVGPNWQGELPSGIKKIDSPTNLVWAIAQIQTNGKEDYRSVHKLQKQLTLTPLNHFKKSKQAYHKKWVKKTDKIDLKTPATLQVEQMSAEDFFSNLAQLMKDNPPLEKESRMIKQFRKIGIAPGKKFELKALPENTVKGIEKAIPYALKQIKVPPPNNKIVNGWRITTMGVGKYGSDYLQRARVAYSAMGTGLPEEAIYPIVTTDSTGRVLNGRNRYILHFKKNQLPPVKGFWSLTLYNAKKHFAANPLQRYALGSRDPLKLNQDGSLSIYIQRQSPGEEKESNWLPTPRGKFDLVLRLYWPSSRVLNGIWMPPPVIKIKATPKF
jgi:hypothetical protein